VKLPVDELVNHVGISGRRPSGGHVGWLLAGAMAFAGYVFVAMATLLFMPILDALLWSLSGVGMAIPGYVAGRMFKKPAYWLAWPDYEEQSDPETGEIAKVLIKDKWLPVDTDSLQALRAETGEVP